MDEASRTRKSQSPNAEPRYKRFRLIGRPVDCQ
jgi:hypothetical protein